MRREPRAGLSRITAAAALLALMLAGCGQRGPLSLPEPVPPAGDAADSGDTGDDDDER